MLVLIVEDCAIDAKLERAALEGRGYDLLVASDAADAFRILRTCRPDLILMDIHLPDMDGLELTRWLRTEDELRGTLIIATTAYTVDTTREQALAAGCDGYITKPIDVHSLPSILDRFLRDSGGDG